jgi:hypothetical protein
MVALVGHRRMTGLRAASLIAVALIVASCGGGGSGTPTGAGGNGGAGTGGPAGTPVAQCNETITTFCKRRAACAVEAGTTFDEASCVKELGIIIGCERTTSSFTNCLADTKVVSCPLTRLPESCSDPIAKTPLSAEQMKCDELGGVFCRWVAKCDGITPTAAQLQNCQTLFFQDFDCFFAMSVNEQCIADLPMAPCDEPDGGTADGGSSTPSCDDPITYVP